ncbi:MAG: NAD(P)H-dependent flavin oxidoreductase [Candidatus Hodarchaeota archaeon]
MIWKTRITQLIKTKYPLVMAAFAGFGRTEFAASFSNAGGLGIITALNYKIEEFKTQLKKMKNLTDKPFGINLTVLPPGVRAIGGDLTKEDYLNYLDIALNEGVNIFTTSAYQSTYIGEKVRDAGGIWFHKCALLRHAVSAEKAGADAITIIGMEATGFKNPYQHTTLVNITMAKKFLSIPIIAAGGIGNARGFLGVLAMGAEAVCLGTAILTTEESPAPISAKNLWLNTDITTVDYHRQLYHRSLGATRVLSPAIAYQKEISPLKSFIENLMNEAEEILHSWGFTKEEFNTCKLKKKD